MMFPSDPKPGTNREGLWVGWPGRSNLVRWGSQTEFTSSRTLRYRPTHPHGSESAGSGL